MSRLFRFGHHKRQMWWLKVFGFGLFVKDAKHQSVSYPEHISGFWIGKRWVITPINVWQRRPKGRLRGLK
jgi:hypothetical protein